MVLFYINFSTRRLNLILFVQLHQDNTCFSLSNEFHPPRSPLTKED